MSLDDDSKIRMKVIALAKPDRINAKYIIEAELDDIEELIKSIVKSEQIKILNKAHRFGGRNDYDNSTDEYIDELVEELLPIEERD